MRKSFKQCHPCPVPHHFEINTYFIKKEKWQKEWKEMYYERFFPFYTAWPGGMYVPGEQLQEQEFELMKSYYPDLSRKIQELVEQSCDRVDYEGSRIYDEYPDRFMLRQMCTEIRGKLEQDTEMQAMGGSFMDELIQVLLFHEISRRRCRRHRCRRYW